MEIFFKDLILKRFYTEFGMWKIVVSKEKVMGVIEMVMSVLCIIEGVS